ncbi:MAG: HNH endonuclease signature motif containing protein [Spirochaetaceae bacterium]|nr:HNH endonuclease signature motif containing protein [Spirochaetaceae bacterium]
MGVGGVLERATCSADPQFDADRCEAVGTPGRGGRGCPTSAPKRLADAAGHGAAGPAERSPALERHLAALRCFGALPDARSRYIPAPVRREVWRRDQGCCSYVDRYSGRRCSSRYRLEIDHIVPFALGGGEEPGNLRLRCRAHHRLRHAQRHGHPMSMAD